MDLVEKLKASSLEGGEEVGVGLGLDEGVADLRGDNETVLFDATDASGFLDGGRRGAKEGLVDLLLQRRRGLFEGRRVGEGWRSYEKEII